MHTGFTVEFDHAWLGGRDFPRERGRALLRLLAELAQSGSLREAAERAGVSYRAAWGALGDGARLFGAPLVDMQRGRRAQLSALGHRVLAADERVREGLGQHFERLRAEIPALLADALTGARPHLTIHASHDLALEALRALCRRSLELEVIVRGADDSLAALARGECDVAGFHVANALPRAAAAAAALGRWLDPRKHTLIHFVTREQGLIARPGSRIRGVHDLARPGVRFIHRQQRSAEGEEISVAEAVAEGRADAGFGLRADATRHGLGFTPLAIERYFFACTKAALQGAALKTLLEILRQPDFAARVAKLPGYDASQSGRREALDAALTWVGRPMSGKSRRRG
jgi:molybdate transport repressor ModE-like protein